jgi:hypothetical protein
LVFALACRFSPARAGQNPPAAPAQPAARDPEAELQRLLEEVTRLDPKAPDYQARLRLIVENLIRVNQSLARENAALRQQLAAAPPASPARPASRSGGTKAEARTSGSGTETAKADPAATAPGALFGKRGLKKYHRVGCQFGDRINPADRVVFASPEAAKAAGYEPCRVCRPDAPAPPK